MTDYARRWRWRRRWLRYEAHWGKRRPWRDNTGRWYGTVDLTNFPYPYVRVHGEGEDYAYIAVGFGHPGSDPAVHVEVDLERTRLGRWIAWAAWRCRSVTWWLAHRRDAPEAPEDAAHSEA